MEKLKNHKKQNLGGGGFDPEERCDEWYLEESQLTDSSRKS